MQILHLLPTNQFGGAEKVVLQICINDNFNNHLVLCGGEKVREVFIQNKINCLSLNNCTKKEIIKEISKLVKYYKVSIIHAHGSTMSFLGYLSNKLYNLNCKIISHIHGCDKWLDHENKYKKVDRVVRNKYDLNIYCSKIVKDYYQNNARYINKSNTTLLENSVSIDEDSDYLTKEEFNLTDKFILGYIGRLSEEKGIIDLINAANKIKSELKNIVILIVGDGFLFKKATNLVQKLDLEENFRFLGFQSSVNKFYSLIDILILPSRSEGLPMTILEGMANKKSIVAMNVGGVSEVIKNKETGILIEEGRVDKLLKESLLLKENSELLKNLGDRAYNFVSKNYSINNQIEKLNIIYRNVMGECV